MLLENKEEYISDIAHKFPELEESRVEELSWIYASLKTKQLFLNFFIETINNYLAFISPDDGSFNLEGYLSKFPDSEFMKNFTRTQGFNQFIHMNRTRECGGDQDVKFFRKNVKLLIQSSDFKALKKEQKKLIDQAFKAVQFPIRYSFDHCKRAYDEEVTNSTVQMGEGPIHEKFVLPMPGIDYSKIEKAKEARNKKRVKRR